MIDSPDPDTILWRYTSFAKFAAMLTRRTLWFARPDTFNDRFEGAVGLSTELEYSQVKDRIETELEAIGYKGLPYDAFVTVSQYVRALLRIQTQTTFVNCWHESAYESEAMWQLYSVNTAEGIAIETTARELEAQLVSHRDETGDETLQLFGAYKNVFLGKVRYVDYATDSIPTKYRYFFKRKSFEHEKEVRAAIIRGGDTPPELPGIEIPCDLSRLIHRIIVSPLAPVWLHPTTEELCRRFELTAPIVKSSLADEPLVP